MSRLEVPLAYRKLQTTGDIVVHAELTLAIKTDRGAWEPITFLVDSGTEMTTMPAEDAKDQYLPIPKRPVSGLTFQGLEVRSGLLRARIPAMDATSSVQVAAMLLFEIHIGPKHLPTLHLPDAATPPGVGGNAHLMTVAMDVGGRLESEYGCVSRRQNAITLTAMSFRLKLDGQTGRLLEDDLQPEAGYALRKPVGKRRSFFDRKVGRNRYPPHHLAGR